MAYEKQKALLKRLITKTDAGTLGWKKSADEEAFLVAFTSNSVRLSKEEIGHETPIYAISLINMAGSIVDRFTDADLDLEEFGVSDQKNYTEMKELFDKTRRQANGADKILTDILKELE